MKICVFITTRYHSTRLPEKAVMRMGEDTMTDILIKRVKEAGLPVIMVTPTTPEDITYLSPLAKKHDIGYFAGENQNIIQRHLDCAAMNDIEWIINVDGDDILTCPDLIAEVKDMIETSDGNYDCAHLTGYPLGLNLLAYTVGRLSRVEYMKDTNWGAKVLEIGPVMSGDSSVQFTDCRLTFDYMEDYFVFRDIIWALGKKTNSDRICEYMMQHPEIRAINNFRNDEYFKRLEAMSR